MNKWEQSRISKYKQIAIDIVNKSIETDEIFIDFTIAQNDFVENKSWWTTFFIGPFSLLSSLIQPELCILILTNKRLILAGINYVGVLVSNPYSYPRKDISVLETRKVFSLNFAFRLRLVLQINKGKVLKLKLALGNYEVSSKAIIEALVDSPAVQ